MSEFINKYKEIFQGFSKLNHKERLEVLHKSKVLSDKHFNNLKLKKSLDLNLAENFIENAIGYFELPMGVATNFVIDNKAYVIPMAVEETSIIAAASKTAKWVAAQGSIKTFVEGDEVIGQIQIPRVKNLNQLKEIIKDKSQEWISLANKNIAASLVQRGGGVTRVKLRHWQAEDKSFMAVIHIYVNTCEAMGANTVNQVCEYLKPHVEKQTQEVVGLCILSNLSDSKCTKAVVEISIDKELALKIEEASRFAWEDSYRAATNNKGVLNGIDPILIATGNDWRAVEAGIHAYSTKSGRYRSITSWTYKNKKLIGEFKAPIILGTVGGVTKLHPTAQMNLEILGNPSSANLSRICAAVGLVQNLGALRALTTVGIIEGHMKLHIKNLSVSAGATDKEMPLLQKQLEEQLNLKKGVSLTKAKEALQTLRNLGFYESEQTL